jgi:carboxymethylenebutenolidase
VDYGAALDAANGRVGAVGFCWGGRATFGFAAQISAVGAGVVYYGASPSADRMPWSARRFWVCTARTMRASM